MFSDKVEVKRTVVINDKLKNDIAAQLRKGFGLQWHMRRDGKNDTIWLERQRLPFFHRHKLAQKIQQTRVFLRAGEMNLFFGARKEMVTLEGPGISNPYKSLVQGNYFTREWKQTWFDLLHVPWTMAIHHEVKAKDKGKVKKLMEDLADDITTRPGLYTLIRSSYG